MASHVSGFLDLEFEPRPQQDRAASAARGVPRVGARARALGRGLLVALVFFAGFSWGFLAGTESERAQVEIQQTLW